MDQQEERNKNLKNLDGPYTEKEPERQTISVQTMTLNCQLISFWFRSLFMRRIC